METSTEPAPSEGKLIAVSTLPSYGSGMTNSERGALGVVDRWLAAINAGDGQLVESLSHEQVEIVGPRGSGIADRSILTEWLTRSGFSSHPVRWFCGGDGTVVVDQDARWTDPQTGAAQERKRIGSQFQIRDGRVAKYVRFDEGVQAALSAAGLDEQRDLVTDG